MSHKMENGFVLLVLCAVCIEGRIQTNITSFSHESKLIHDIHKLYEQLGTESRPLINSSDSINVYYGLRLITLDVDEEKQMLTTSVWIRMMWFDRYIKWQKEDYGGMKNVILPYKSIWMPEDITLVNTAEADIDVKTVELQVKNNGRVFYAPHVVFKSGCLIDLTNYPFDIQTCDLWIQSASRYSWDLKLVPYTSSSLDLDTYLGSFKEAKDWDVIGNSTEYISNPREHGAILMYSRRGALRFTFVLKRRVGFMGVLLILPCILLSMMVSIIFCLPTERPDRHMLAMSLFASYMVLLLILTTNAPPSAASVPSLGKYYCFNMLMIIFSIFVSVFVIFVGRQAETKRPPPKWIQILFLKYIARLCCLGQQTTHLQSKSESSQNDSQPIMCDPEKGSVSPSRYPQPRQKENITGQERIMELEQEVSCLHAALSNQTTKAPSKVQRQWKMITVLLDRLCAIMFFIINVITIIVFLPKPSAEWLK